MCYLVFIVANSFLSMSSGIMSCHLLSFPDTEDHVVSCLVPPNNFNMMMENLSATLSKNFCASSFHHPFGIDDIQLSATSYFRKALSVGIKLSPEQIVRKLDALDQREPGDETLEELGT